MRARSGIRRRPPIDRGADSRGGLITLLAALLLAACQPTAIKPAVPSPTAAASTTPATAPAAAVTAARPSKPESASAKLTVAAPVLTYSGTQVLDRIQASLTAPACIDGRLNKRWRGHYGANARRFSSHLRETLALMAYVLDQTEAANLPGEFALIPIVESWYRPDASGRGGPTGMWQMIAPTAKDQGVIINADYDGRLSPIDSTRAALSYLGQLQHRFDDWRLAAMAYNAGEYRLRRAMRRSGHAIGSGENRTPAGLASHTYDYVAKLRALACLISQPERQPLQLPEYTAVDRLVVLTLPPQMGSLDAAAQALGIDPTALRRLNPAFRNGRIGPTAPRAVLVPASTQPRWAALTAPEAGRDAPAAIVDTAPRAGPTTMAREHLVTRGDSLWKIARSYGLTLEQLRAWNNLRVHAVIYPGQVLRLQP